MYRIASGKLVVLTLSLLLGFAPGLHAQTQLHIGILNANGPLLAGLPDEERREILMQWGDELLSQADVAIISDLGAQTPLSNESLAILQSFSSMTNRFDMFWDPSYPDVGILSRYPVVDSIAHSIPGNKTILDVTIRIDGARHRILATHFAGEPDPRAPSRVRLESVSRIRDLLSGQTNVILGGDLETCRPVASDELDGPRQFECAGESSAGIEYNMLSSVMKDAFQVIGGVPGEDHCDERRVDYVFFRGPYQVLDYQGCIDAEPSEHPFVLVTLRIPGPTPTPTRTPTLTPTATATRTPTRTPTPACPPNQTCCPGGDGRCVCVPDYQGCSAQ